MLLTGVRFVIAIALSFLCSIDSPFAVAGVLSCAAEDEPLTTACATLLASTADAGANEREMRGTVGWVGTVLNRNFLTPMFPFRFRGGGLVAAVGAPG